MPGERIRVDLPSEIDGVRADFASALGVGRALALGLVDRRLPVAVRYPVVGSVAWAFGSLVAQLQADVAGPLTKREMVEKRRRLAALFVMHIRLDAAALTAPAALQEQIELLSRVFGAPARPCLVGVMRPASARARLRGMLGGLALYTALRDQFDEDWYRNPRSDEPLIDAARQGGATSVEALVELLGGDLSAPAARLGEWL